MSVTMSVPKSVIDHSLPLSETLAPTDQAALAAAVTAAHDDGTPIYPLGGGRRAR